ncbi:MAG: aconitate hydratase, partial [Clostridia bacterium]|nr:aconitate hydratase [Clostridia bacterium]
YLGVKAVVALSFARIHRKNLINFGILPVVADIYAEVGDDVEISFDREKVTVKNLTRSLSVEVPNELAREEYDLIVSGGLLAGQTPRNA